MAQTAAAPDAINRSLVLRTPERMEWLWRRCEEYIGEVEVMAAVLGKWHSNEENDRAMAIKEGE